MYWLFALSVFITLGMALMLYRHFNFLFETQYQMTQELIVLLKEKLQEPRNQTGREIEAKDWLYGVNYNLESEE